MTNPLLSRWIVTGVAAMFAAAPVVAFSQVPAAAPAGDQARADRVLDRAVAAHNAITTLRADFVQTITNPLTGSSVDAAGELQQKMPKLLNITFSKPKGDKIVSDGQSLWVYLPSAMPGQVMRLPLSMSGGAGMAGAGVDLLGQFFEKPRARYTVSDLGPSSVEGRKTYSIVLKPKGAANGAFQKATLWIDDESGFLRQFETTDLSGITRKVRFVRMRPGAEPDDDAFRFVKPQGARLVEPPSGLSASAPPA